VADRVNDRPRARGPGRLPSTSAPSPLARSRSPPPVSRLRRLDPASDAPSPASLRRPARRETAAGSSPTRLRRQTPLVDFCNRYDPRARPPDRWKPRPLVLENESRALEDRVRASLEGRRSRVTSGQGPRTVARATRPLPTRLLASEALPRPDWPGHLMSRSLVVLEVGSPLGGAESRPLVAPSRASARLLGRGASHEAPRRDLVFRAPEVPSVAGPPRERMGLVHRLSPDCGEPAKRFFNLRRRPTRLDSRAVLCRLDSKRSKLCFCEDPR
jgi:hypothetical protein